MPKERFQQYEIEVDHAPLWGAQALADLLGEITQRHGFDVIRLHLRLEMELEHVAEDGEHKAAAEAVRQEFDRFRIGGGIMPLKD